MTGNEYQKLALGPASKTNLEDLLQYLEVGPITTYTSPEHSDCLAAALMATAGLTGEAGEVAEFYKKKIFHKHDDTKLPYSKLKEELGDVLWYVARLASANHWNLEDIMQGNLDKLNARYEGGFTHAASINRVV